MSRGPRKIPDLSAVTTISNTDLFVIEQVSNTTSTTCKITGSSLKKAVVDGPYETDTEAEDGGIEIGELYYISSGEVRVRLT